MGRQHTRTAKLRVIAGTALAGLGVLVFWGNFDWAVARLKGTYCGAHRDGLAVIPVIAMAVWQTLQAIGLEHHRLLECFLQMLPSFWPLIHALAGAV